MVTDRSKTKELKKNNKSGKMAQDRAPAAPEELVASFHTYEDFLDSRVTAQALYYLGDEDLARRVLEPGPDAVGGVLTRKEFEAASGAAVASRQSNQRQERTLASAGKELKDNFLRALAQREEANRSGKMNTIIFIRDRNASGNEISAYIDYAHRLQTEDFKPYFSGKKRLMPRRSDLSFFNWNTQLSTSNPSANYELIVDNPDTGLLFKNKRDRKCVNVDPMAATGDNSCRTPLSSELYTQVVFYDHITRRTS